MKIFDTKKVGQSIIFTLVCVCSFFVANNALADFGYQSGSMSEWQGWQNGDYLNKWSSGGVFTGSNQQLDTISAYIANANGQAGMYGANNGTLYACLYGGSTIAEQGTFLGCASIPMTSVSSFTAQWYDFTFSSPISLTSGTAYNVVMSAGGSTYHFSAGYTSGYSDWSTHYWFAGTWFDRASSWTGSTAGIKMKTSASYSFSIDSVGTQNPLMMSSATSSTYISVSATSPLDTKIYGHCMVEGSVVVYKATDVYPFTLSDIDAENQFISNSNSVCQYSDLSGHESELVYFVNVPAKYGENHFCLADIGITEDWLSGEDFDFAFSGSGGCVSFELTSPTATSTNIFNDSDSSMSFATTTAMTSESGYCIDTFSDLYSECSATNIGCFLWGVVKMFAVPHCSTINDLKAGTNDLLRQFPFSIISNIYDVVRTYSITNYNDSHSTALSLNWTSGYSQNSSSTLMTFFNTDSLSTLFVDFDITAWLRVVISIVIWIIFAWGCYKLAVSIF